MTEREQAIRRIPWTGDSTVPYLLSIIEDLRVECAQRKDSLTKTIQIAGELVRYTHGGSRELECLRERLEREMVKSWAGSHVAEAVTAGIRADMDGNASNFVEAMRDGAATQTVGVSGASTTMQVGGEPRQGQDLPDVALDPGSEHRPRLGAILERKTADLEDANLCEFGYRSTDTERLDVAKLGTAGFGSTGK